jgi:hypothetical protein
MLALKRHDDVRFVETRCIIHNGTSFSAVDSHASREMIKVIAAAGPIYTLVSRTALATTEQESRCTVFKNKSSISCQLQCLGL